MNNLPATINWNDQGVIATIRKTICPANVNDEEFKLFTLICQQKALNPLTKEIWCIKSKDYTNKQGVRVEGKLQIMVGIDGYLVRADRHPQFDGLECSTTLSESGEAVFSDCKVFRKDRGRPVSVRVHMKEYFRANPYGSEGTWEKMPITMLEKVAKAHALREAFPSEFGGMYIPEEMPVETPDYEITSTAAERRRERAKALEQPQVVEQEESKPDVVVEAQEQPELPLQDKAKEIHIYRVPEPTFEQRAYLTKHCEWDPEWKVWLAKKDLGEKLAKFKIKQEEL